MNKEPTDPSRCWSCIRALLLEAAIQTSNHQNQQDQQTPLDRTARPADAAALQPDTGGARIATDPAEPPVTRAKKEKGFLDAAADEPVAGQEDPHGPISTSTSARPAGAHSETWTADAAAGGNGKVEVEGGDANHKGGGVGCGGAEEDVSGSAGSASKSPVEVYVDQCAWRVLHAASRTASGGDSFFVVQVR